MTGSQLLTELSKLQEKHFKLESRAEQVRDPTYIAKVRQETKVLQKTLDSVVAEHKQLQAASHKIEQTFKRFEKGKLPLIEGAESHVSGAINAFNFNSQKTQLVSDKVQQAMRLQELTEIKL